MPTPKFTARVITELPTQPGRFKGTQVGVFQDGLQVGSYQRNYEIFYDTFCPFVGADGKWYALYSPNYSITRVLSLPGCKDIGGEHIGKWGFCPTGFYVPRFREYVIPIGSFGHKEEETERDYETWDDPYDPTDPEKWERVGWGDPDNPNTWPGGHETREDCPALVNLETHMIFLNPIKYDLRCAFVQGCLWGDESSWKLEALDLTEAHLGKIRRYQPFGYLELPVGVPLKTAVRVSGDSKYLQVHLASSRCFRLTTEWGEFREDRDAGWTALTPENRDAEAFVVRDVVTEKIRISKLAILIGFLVGLVLGIILL